MKSRVYKLILAILICSTIPFSALFAVAIPNGMLNSLVQLAPDIPVNALRSSLHAYYYGLAQGDVKNQKLAIVDMQLPSSQKRLWVFNMQKPSLLFYTYAAHAESTGVLYAKFFSNALNSKETSLGVYITGNEYYGHHGLSLLLNGMEPGFNNNAIKRDVVIHGASYVSKLFVHEHHRLGRSWGCVAVNFDIVQPMVKSLKGGAMLIIYYPEQAWLLHSKFLNN